MKFPRNSASLTGVEILVKAVRRRFKAAVRSVTQLGHSDANSTTSPKQPRWLIPEILEMIIGHLVYDTPTLEACAAACFALYNVATPHLHRTVVFREWNLYPANRNSETRFGPLQSLSELGLLPLAKELEFRRTFNANRWVVPAVLDSSYFRAMVNLQELKIADLDFPKFPIGFGESLGHFAPTLRSISLSHPNGTRLQLLDFFRLFPKLDDVEILCYGARQETYEALDSQLVPISGGLRGQLILYRFGEKGLLMDMIVAFGGMRFTSMDLLVVQGMQLLVEACAGTLETLRISPDDMLDLAHPNDFTLSRNTVLCSIEIPVRQLGRHTKDVVSTISAPTFYEVVIVFSEREVSHETVTTLACEMRQLHEIYGYRTVFCLEASEASRREKLHMLALETEKAIAAGLYDFLPCPPLVFSRTLAKCHPRYPPH